jgi:hypothetical protein
MLHPALSSSKTHYLTQPAQPSLASPAKSHDTVGDTTSCYTTSIYKSHATYGGTVISAKSGSTSVLTSILSHSSSHVHTSSSNYSCSTRKWYSSKSPSSALKANLIYNLAYEELDQATTIYVALFRDDPIIMARMLIQHKYKAKNDTLKIIGHSHG